jgi:predicted dehydrogenase
VRVLIVGVGELGSRHAQSLAQVPHLSEITLVDPSDNSLRVATERVRSTGYGGKILALPTLVQDQGAIELAVISTSSNERLASLSLVLENSKAQHVLLEKLLTPSAANLSSFRQIFTRKESKFWLNCPMSFFPHYQAIENELDLKGSGPRLSYTVQGGNHGLITNAIHYLEHFTRLSSSSIANLRFKDGARVISSKRYGYSEIIGHLLGETIDGDLFSVEFDSETHGDKLEIKIEQGENSFLVDEIELTSQRIGPHGNFETSPISTPKQSELTHQSMELILKGKSPLWADANVSIDLHDWLFRAISAGIPNSNELSFT